MKSFLILAFLLVSSLATAQDLSPRERDSVRAAQASTKKAAQDSVAALFARLCPGRCEVIGVEVEMEAPRALGPVTPGFESVTGASLSVDPKSIQVSVLLDSKLPRNFQRNIPRMIQHRLGSLAPVVEVRPELLDFPEPQLEPLPPFYPEPPRSQPAPAPMPDPAPLPEPAAEEVKEAPPAPVGEPSVWESFGPWIGPLIMAILLFLMMLYLLKRIAEIAKPQTSETESVARKRSVDVEALREEVLASRPVRNRMMRAWVNEDLDGAVRAVHVLGPDVLNDLKSEKGLKPALQQVAKGLVETPEPIDAELESVVAQIRTRLRAAQVLHDDSAAAEWEFLEGVAPGSVMQAAQKLTPAELLHVVGHLRPEIQGALMERLTKEGRESLFSGAAKGLSRTESQELASRFRRAVEEFGQESSEAQVLGAMLGSLNAAEQEETMRELRQKRPQLAAEVLSGHLLESAVSYAPPEAVADALLRVELESLAAFARGSSQAIRDSLLSLVSGSRKAALEAELSLEIPVGRAAFLEARKAFLSNLQGALEREGEDILRVNSKALMKKPLNPVEANEASS